MSNLDKKMSEFLQATGAAPKTVLRTRYLDDVLRMSREGYSDEQIDELLSQRWVEESGNAVADELQLRGPPTSRATKWKRLGYKIGSYFMPIASAWLIWIFVLFTLTKVDLMYISRERDWLAWIVLPPLATICVVLWARRFLFSKNGKRT